MARLPHAHCLNVGPRRNQPPGHTERSTEMELNWKHSHVKDKILVAQSTLECPVSPCLRPACACLFLCFHEPQNKASVLMRASLCFCSWQAKMPQDISQQALNTGLPHFGTVSRASKCPRQHREGS